MKKRSSNGDESQFSLIDFGDDLFSEEEKKEIETISSHIDQHQQASHENHIEDSDKFKEDDDENDSNLRSEQIIISKNNYPSILFSDDPAQFYLSIDILSKCNHFSKNLFNQCIYQIRQSFFGKIDINPDSSKIPEKEKELRIKIKSALNKFDQKRSKDGKGFNYKNTIYKLLDKYFRDLSKDRSEEAKDNDNYSWSPQAAQQIIDMATEAWYDNDLARDDYEKHPEHRADYTGKPGIVGYRKGNEYISVFTNQQCKIETKQVLDTNTIDQPELRYETKNFITFPDHLNIKPVETRLSGKNTDLREVRIIPLVRKGYYKVEAVYNKAVYSAKAEKHKVIDKIKIKSLNLDPKRIIGIDTGQENVVTIGNNIGIEPLIIKGGVILAENQWFDKRGSKLYEKYYRQQKHQGKESKGKPIIMGSKMKILSFNRTNKILDILHKISRYIVNYCTKNRIGCIIWGRNPGWKQEINLGKKTNQKFTKIPHYLLFKMLKYKAEEIGIKVIDVLENHTSKCSFLDLEEIGHKEKGKYLGKRGKKGMKIDGKPFGRGLFRSLKGIIINSDVNGAYNIIRKVFPDAFNKFIRNGDLILKTVGIVCSKTDKVGDLGVVLHPQRLSIKDLL